MTKKVFRKYPSLINDYHLKSITMWVDSIEELHTCRYEITEKLHGCNFQVMIDKDGIKFGKRTAYGHVHGSQDVMPKYADQFALFAKFRRDNDLESITLYGEMFGDGVQKGVRYGEKKFRIFNIRKNENILSPVEMDLILKGLGLEWMKVPTYDIVDGITNAMDFDININSVFTPDGVENNTIEGVVIKPYDKIYSYDNGSYFFIKKKNDIFSEKKGESKKHKKPSSYVLQMKEEFERYITEQRMINCFSKFGEIQEPSEIGGYINLLVSDTIDDFIGDNTLKLEEFDRNTDAGKYIYKSAAHQYAIMLKKFLANEI